MITSKIYLVRWGVDSRQVRRFVSSVFRPPPQLTIIIIIVIISGTVGKSGGHFCCMGCALLCQKKSKLK